MPPLNILPGRTSDASRASNFNSTIATIQEKMNTAESQASSGKFSRSYGTKSMAPNTRSFLRFEQDQQNQESIQKGITTLNTRLNGMVTIVDRLKSISAEAWHRSTQAADTSAIDVTFPQFCRDRLTEIERLLNKTDAEGRNLFGGIQSQGRIVDFTILPTPTLGDTPNAAFAAAYFTGTSDAQNSTLLEGQTINYGLSADGAFARDLIFYLKMGSGIVPDGLATSTATQTIQTIQGAFQVSGKTLGFAGESLGQQLRVLESSREMSRNSEGFAQESIAEYNAADYFTQFLASSTATLQLSMNQTLEMRAMQNFQSLLNKL
jgi:flagellin-like hook-associated protein FlgL